MSMRRVGRLWEAKHWLCWSEWVLHRCFYRPCWRSIPRGGYLLTNYKTSAVEPNSSFWKESCKLAIRTLTSGKIAQLLRYTSFKNNEITWKKRYFPWQMSKINGILWQLSFGLFWAQGNGQKLKNFNRSEIFFWFFVYWENAMHFRILTFPKYLYTKFNSSGKPEVA